MNELARVFVIEGPDGSGKTTTAKNIVDRLRVNYPNHNVEYLREPGGSERAEKVREEIMSGENLTTREMAELFAKSRKYMHEDQSDIFESDSILIMDRSYFASVVYQGFVGGVPVNDVMDMNKEFVSDVPLELGIILIGDPKILRERSLQDDVNHFDSKGVEYHQAVGEGYKKLLDVLGDTLGDDSPEMYYLDVTNLSLDEVEERVYGKITEKMEEF